jgi:hypothetical protein
MHGLIIGDLLDVENAIPKVFCVVLRVGGIVGTFWILIGGGLWIQNNEFWLETHNNSQLF